MKQEQTKVVTENVGNAKLFENDKVAVWAFELEPGEESALHTHERSYMWYTIQGAPLQIFDEHGSDVGLFEVPTGGVFSLKCEDGVIEVLSDNGKGSTIPATHKAKNIGKNTYREILVEYK